jgi:tRNA pseudouridine55 synthase
MMTRIISKKTVDKINQKAEDNLILMDKPTEWTSFDVVKKIRTIGRFRKVGHAGTLDPFATGLLILGTGKLTRDLTHISESVKAYTAKITFGTVTDTYDVTGDILEKKEISKIDASRVRQVIESFIGESEQIPPMYSAKKINGTRLYKLARQGKNITRKPQKINIYELHQKAFDGLDVELYIKCSKGTYIRSIANDMGLQTGYGAYLKELRRVSINGFFVQDALSVAEFKNYWTSLN